MKTNYLKFIRTNVNNNSLKKGGNMAILAKNLAKSKEGKQFISDAKKIANSEEGKQTIDNAKKLLKSEEGKKLKGIAKDVLTGKEDINTAVKRGEGIVKKMAQSEEGQQINDVLNKVAPNHQGQQINDVLNKVAPNQQGQQINDVLNKVAPNQQGQQINDVLNKVAPNYQGQQINNADNKESSNSKLYNLKKKLVSNNNKSVSYPEYLQVLPLDNHMKHKLSSEFSTHIKNIKEKIDNATELINRQETVNEDNQIILDEIKKEYIEEEKISEEKMQDRVSEYFKLLSNTIGNAIVEFINMVFDIIRIIISFIRSPIGWAIITIIVLCIVVSFILFMVLPLFGVNIIKDDKEKNDDKNKDKDKVECSNKFKIDGIEEEWNWSDFMKNPAGYSLNKGLNSIKQNIKMPNALNNMYYNIVKPLGIGFQNMSGNIIIDKYKFNRPEYISQRTDTITNINYDLLSNNIKDKYSESFKNKNNSITLLKPKDIKWEFPHLDYRNTDYSKLPESIKKYKDETDKNAFSLNDTKNINFKWELVDDEYIISCNSKFDNNVNTNLFVENLGICESNTINLNQYINE